MAPPSLGNLGAKFSEKCHSLTLRPTLLKSAIVIFRQKFKMFDSNNFTSQSSMFSFQNACPINRKAVYTFPYVFIHPCENRIRSQLPLFLLFVISVNIQAVAGGIKEVLLQTVNFTG